MNKIIRYFHSDAPSGWFIPVPEAGIGVCKEAANVELYDAEKIRQQIFYKEYKFVWKRCGDGYTKVYLRKGEHIATTYGQWSWGMSSNNTVIMVIIDSETREIHTVPASECFCFEEDNR